ncbi:MAG: amidohydrolase family protein [Acidobacteria bacterium]|nr:amidohydrolase family protein [Acidobacteriota bacterium]
MTEHAPISSATSLSPQARRCIVTGLAALVLLGMGTATAAAQATDPVTAFVGGTIIDGNGGPPLQNGTVLVVGREIRAVGPRAEVVVPEGARVIDATGRYVLPGLIDTNVHTSLYGLGETLNLYLDRNRQIVQESAQLMLKHGVTTIRDSYGILPDLIHVRDAIERGEIVGPRMRVGGNIVGWGGPCSISFSLIRESTCELFALQFNDLITQGANEDLMAMTLDELRVAINRYLDLGPDQIRYGGSSHFTLPGFIGFSPDAQRILVEETQRRGRPAETNSSMVEGMRISVLAGIDVLQHPEALDRDMPDELVRLIRERGIVCSLRTGVITGEPWSRHLAARATAAPPEPLPDDRPLTSAERQRRQVQTNPPIEVRRQNAEKLIRGGCLVSVGSDTFLGAAPEFRRTPKPLLQEPGIGTWFAIEGLVELGMTPSQAVVAATKHGAMAARALDRFGTLEAGKLADVLLLSANPLDDISNIRSVEMVMKDGQLIDREALPTHPIWRPLAVGARLR